VARSSPARYAGGRGRSAYDSHVVPAHTARDVPLGISHQLRKSESDMFLLWLLPPPAEHIPFPTQISPTPCLVFLLLPGLQLNNLRGLRSRSIRCQDRLQGLGHVSQTQNILLYDNELKYSVISDKIVDKCPFLPYSASM
jgi:hypothetical protein